MSDVRFDMSEVDALSGRFDLKSLTVDRDASDVVGDSAGAVERFAKSIAPVDTGEYRNGIVQTGHGMDRSVEATAPHSIYVEFGTSRQAPQPVMFPASDRGETSLVDGLEDVAEKVF